MYNSKRRKCSVRDKRKYNRLIIYNYYKEEEYASSIKNVTDCRDTTIGSGPKSFESRFCATANCGRDMIVRNGIT